jgi:hypothetical protein
MYNQTKCLICGGDTSVIGKARVVPFIVFRMYGGNTKPIYTKLRYCSGCNFYFYEARPDKKEIKNIYKNYLTEEYKCIRKKYEWWYSYIANHRRDIKFYNDINYRRQLFSKMIDRYSSDIKTALDYGSGQCVHFLHGHPMDSYDIDGNESNNKTSYDLVVMSQVAEHLSDPMKHIKKFDCKYLYIEVPRHLPFSLNPFKKRPLMQIIIDLWKIFSYRTLYHEYEHISYFTERALEKLYNRSGYDVVYMDTINDDIFAIGKKR